MIINVHKLAARRVNVGKFVIISMMMMMMMIMNYVTEREKDRFDTGTC